MASKCYGKYLVSMLSLRAKCERKSNQKVKWRWATKPWKFWSHQCRRTSRGRRLPITWIKYVADIKNWPHFQICILSPKMSSILSKSKCHVITLTITIGASGRIVEVEKSEKSWWKPLGKSRYYWDKLQTKSRGNLSGEKDGLPTLTGCVGCPSDLDPSAHPSSPQPHVPKQATLATRANNNAFWNQENIPQKENNFSQLLPLNVGDRWELQPFIYCLKSLMLNLGVTWWIRKVWQSGNPNLCTAVE